MALTNAQNALVDRVEYHADQVTADAQTVGLNRDAAYGQLKEAALAMLWQLPRDLLMPLAVQSSPPLSNSSSLPITAVFLDSLQNTYIRLIRIQLESWNRPLYQLSDPRSDHWRLQYNTYTQGDPRNPAAIATPLNVDQGGVLKQGSTQSQYLLACTPKDPGPSLQELLYIPKKDPEDFPDELLDPLVWKATARVLEAQKEGAAVDAEERAIDLMSDLKVGYAPPGSYRT
jgi:hypothetical protein